MLARYLALPALAVAALLGGCRSDDQHEFAMPLDRSGKVIIVDAMTDQEVWSKDLPPGHKLVLEMKRDQWVHNDGVFLTSGAPADSAKWKMYKGHGVVVLDRTPLEPPATSGRINLNGTPVRIEVTYDRVQPAGSPVIMPATTADTPAPDTAATPEASEAPEAPETSEAPEAMDTPAPEVAPVETTQPAEPVTLPTPEAPAAPETAPETPAPATPAPADDPAFK